MMDILAVIGLGALFVIFVLLGRGRGCSRRHEGCPTRSTCSGCPEYDPIGEEKE